MTRARTPLDPTCISCEKVFPEQGRRRSRVLPRHHPPVDSDVRRYARQPALTPPPYLSTRVREERVITPSAVFTGGRAVPLALLHAPFLFLSLHVSLEPLASSLAFLSYDPRLPHRLLLCLSGVTSGAHRRRVRGVVRSSRPERSRVVHLVGALQYLVASATSPTLRGGYSFLDDLREGSLDAHVCRVASVAMHARRRWAVFLSSRLVRAGRNRGSGERRG